MQTNDINQHIEPITETNAANDDKYEYSSDSEPIVTDAAKSTKKLILDMPTTPKILQHVELQACGLKMSAKNLKYSHANYCTERGREEQPEAIPIPKLKNTERQAPTRQGNPAREEGKPKVNKDSIIERGGGGGRGKTPPSTPSTPALPEQTLEMDESFQYKMVQRTKQKQVKYQLMMSNAV